MSINFCSQQLISSIICDKTCFDGHEVTNLPAQSSHVKRKGFIADYFVKPPVSIKLKFICQIDINHIFLKTYVGAQRSVSFIIQTKGVNGKGNVVTANNLQEANSVVFFKFGDERFSEDRGQTSSHVNIPFHCPYRLSKVEELTLTIIKTANSSVPCLGQLEVWGKASSTVPKAIVDSIDVMSQQSNSPMIQHQPLPISQPSKPDVNVGQPKPSIEMQEELPFKIPEEFIDPITCTLMLYPTILPCGLRVDRRTLLKCWEVDDNCYRPHSDPFTGVPFSKVRPVTDTVLKSKIDKFLLQHSNLDVIKNMPRVIGSAPTCTLPGMSQGDSSSYPGSSYRIENDLTDKSASSCAVTSPSFPNPRRFKRSFDRVIADSLVGLPSYLEPNSIFHRKEQCYQCKTDSHLYKLPCSDFLCKICLLKVVTFNDLVCKLCGKQFMSSEPERYHNPMNQWL